MIETEAASHARRMADLDGVRQVGFSTLVMEKILYQSMRRLSEAPVSFGAHCRAIRAPCHWGASGAASRSHLCLPVRRTDPIGPVFRVLEYLSPRHLHLYRDSPIESLPPHSCRSGV